VAFDDLHDGSASADDDGVTHPSDIALLLYTSGTTAEPKGVLHSHETISWEVNSMIGLCALGDRDTVFMPSPLGHVTGLLWGVLLPAKLAIPSVLLDVWDPDRAVGMIERHRCTFSVGATPFLIGLHDVYARTGRGSSLRMFAVGGSDVPASLVQRSREVLDANVFRGYGSSEVPTLTMCSPDGDPWVAAQTDGVPTVGSQLRIDAPDGQPGEILAKAPQMFCGYLDAEATASAFDTEGWLRTGDYGRIENGALVVTGRVKDIILRGGENLSAKEIEDVLYQHPAITEAAVVAMPDAVLGERACAFVVLRPGESLDLDELRGWLDGRRVARQKYPERLVIWPSLPTTASGKVQKFKLREAARRLDTTPVAARSDIGPERG
jgi:cyclohexanecarboxylate-CoA ligase